MNNSRVLIVGGVLLVGLVLPRAVEAQGSRPPATRPVTTRPAATQPADEVALNNAVLRGMDRVMPRVQFQARLSDAIGFIHDVSGFAVEVRWDALSRLGMKQDTKVNVNLTNVKVRDLLDAVLISAAGKPGVLGFAVEHGTVVIMPFTSPTTRPK